MDKWTVPMIKTFHFCYIQVDKIFCCIRRGKIMFTYNVDFLLRIKILISRIKILIFLNTLKYFNSQLELDV